MQLMPSLKSIAKCDHVARCSFRLEPTSFEHSHIRDLMLYKCLLTGAQGQRRSMSNYVTCGSFARKKMAFKLAVGLKWSLIAATTPLNFSLSEGI